MEVIAVMAIMAVVSAMSFETYFTIRDKYSLEKDSDSAVSIIEATRNKSLNRKNDSSYGVAFSSSSVVSFSGSSHSIGNDINKYDLESSVSISDISLSNGSKEIDFNKVTGYTNATGTITLSTRFFSKKINISATGLVELK